VSESGTDPPSRVRMPWPSLHFLVSQYHAHAICLLASIVILLLFLKETSIVMCNVELCSSNKMNLVKKYRCSSQYIFKTIFFHFCKKNKS